MTPDRRRELLAASRLGRLVATGSELPPDQSPPPVLFGTPPEGRKGDLDPAGHWVNISGNNIHITQDGEIDAGGHPALRRVLAEKAGLTVKGGGGADAAAGRVLETTDLHRLDRKLRDHPQALDVGSPAWDVGVVLADLKSNSLRAGRDDATRMADQAARGADALVAGGHLSPPEAADIKASAAAWADRHPPDMAAHRAKVLADSADADAPTVPPGEYVARKMRAAEPKARRAGITSRDDLIEAHRHTAGEAARREHRAAVAAAVAAGRPTYPGAAADYPDLFAPPARPDSPPPTPVPAATDSGGTPPSPPAAELPVSKEAKRLKLTPVKGKITWDGRLEAAADGNRTLYRDPAGQLHGTIAGYKQRQKWAAEQQAAAAEATRVQAETEARQKAETEARQKAEAERDALIKDNTETLSRHFDKRLRKELRAAGHGGDLLRRTRYERLGTTLPDDAPDEAVTLRNRLMGEYQKVFDEAGGFLAPAGRLAAGLEKLAPAKRPRKSPGEARP